jgi:hypothetical protein
MTDMSRPGIEPGPPAWEASTLEKSHLDSLFAGYSETLLGLRPAQQPDLYNIFFLEDNFNLPGPNSQIRVKIRIRGTN